MKYDGNQPFIFGDKNDLNPNSIQALATGAPFLADKIYMLKQNIWNEILTFLGVPNTQINKKERLITDEVNRGLGGVFASRNSGLNARRQACKQINDMFGLDVWVRYREDDEMEERTKDDEQEEGEDDGNVYNEN